MTSSAFVPCSFGNFIATNSDGDSDMGLEYVMYNSGLAKPSNELPAQSTFLTMYPSSYTVGRQ
mgnify:CR=1 FL=1